MKRFKLIIPIFSITFSTVLIEILYTRVFSVLYVSSFAFLMISLALFGYGLSGAYMSISRFTDKKDAIKYLELFLLAFSLSLPVIYKITLSTNIDFLNLFAPFSNFLLLVFNFFLLLLPFFFAGASLVLIFSLYSSEIGKLYFIDLIGAALGGVAIIPFITNFGPSRVILIIFLLLGFSWFLIARMRITKKAIIVFFIVAAFAVLFIYSEALFPIVPKMIKRGYLRHYHNNIIEYSTWSPINKVDVAPFIKRKKIIWIDAGTMQSWLSKFDGKVQKLKPIKWANEAIPYQLTRRGSAFIIGSAGGYEVLCAISHRFKDIIAVEMDPEICHLVKNAYSNYIGNIFHQERVHLINDEGRSVLKRMDSQFDVIQMVNSHNADALLSGGLSIAETYIYTVESFKDYWRHLKDDGFVYIVHWFGERLFSTAFQALREMDIKEPERKFFMVQRENGFSFFFMKKGNIDQEEAEILKEFAGKRAIVYSPFEKMDNLYYQLASPDYKEAVHRSSVNLRPVKDISPYFNQPNKIGQFKFENIQVSGMAQDVVKWALTYSNSVYLSILFLSILLPVGLIFIPLKASTKGYVSKNFVFYFFLIGLSFITVEIIMIKIFQLYLGNPAYSISVIISSLLVSSGIGSLLSKKMKGIIGKYFILIFSVLLFLILVLYSLFLFKIISAFIHFDLIGRVFITFILIFIPGFLMGVFFPTGIEYIGKRQKSMVGWAWGSNAFATVLGSVMTVIIAINWNFSVSLLLAALFYISAGLIYSFSTKGA
jgi:predicted membrane-bound spermidine synthase